MKKHILFWLLSLFLIEFSKGQVVCIMCYDQNDSISSGVHNLILNGSFETSTCTPGTLLSYFCPNSANYNCDILNWTCTGGGSATYANVENNLFSVIPDGNRAAYFGNLFAKVCSPAQNDVSCITDTLCSVIGIPPGYPLNDSTFGGATGVSLEQTVSGLVPGNTYVLEFWAGGEFDLGIYSGKGIFAVDVGFGDTLLRTNPTGPPNSIGIRYIIEFNATASSHTIKFTNWGHIGPNGTELVLDDVRLYTLAELSPIVPSCVPNQVPNVNIASSDTSWCGKKEIDFYDLSTNSPTSWSWYFPGANPSTSNLQNPTGISYNVSGNFPVTLVACNSTGCDSITYNAFIHEYNSLPQPPVIFNGDSLCVSSFSNYQWFEVSDTNTILSTNQCFSPSANGNYFVTVTDTIGCRASSHVISFVISVLENDEKYYFEISENALLDELHVKTNYTKPLEITLYDIASRKLIQQTFSISTSINIQQFAKGIYIFEIRDKNGILQKGKFVYE